MTPTAIHVESVEGGGHPGKRVGVIVGRVVVVPTFSSPHTIPFWEQAIADSAVFFVRDECSAGGVESEEPR